MAPWMLAKINLTLVMLLQGTGNSLDVLIAQFELIVKGIGGVGHINAFPIRQLLDGRINTIG
jgi:hypothetical protein